MELTLSLLEIIEVSRWSNTSFALRTNDGLVFLSGSAEEGLLELSPYKEKRRHLK